MSQWMIGQLSPEVSKRAAGNLAEDKAADYLQARGLKIIARNFYSRGGELDIIAGETEGFLARMCHIIFCEVRSRKNMGYGSALESITPKKQQRIRQTAEYFLLKHQQMQKLPARFDVVIVPVNDSGSNGIEWIKNAF